MCRDGSGRRAGRRLVGLAVLVRLALVATLLLLQLLVAPRQALREQHTHGSRTRTRTVHACTGAHMTWVYIRL